MDVGDGRAEEIAANYCADAADFSVAAGTSGVEFVCWESEEDFISRLVGIFVLGGIHGDSDEVLGFEIRVSDFYFLEAEDLRPVVAAEEFSKRWMGRRVLVCGFV